MDTPPETERRVVTDILHGDEISDPYRWLEETDDDVEEWIERQNEYTDRYLHTETRDYLSPRFEPLAQVATYYPIHVRNDRYFQRVEAPDQDHAVLYVGTTPGTDGDRRTLVNPNAWEGNHSLTWYVPSIDGSHVAYGVTEGGDEQYDIHVLDVETGEVVTSIETVGRASSTRFAWDQDGFYYVATGSAGKGKQLEKEIRYRALDGRESVIGEETDPHVWPMLWTDRETGTLVMGRSEMSGGTDLYVLDDGEFTPAITGTDATFTVHLHEGVAYLQTDYDAPYGRVLAYTLDEMRDGDVAPADLDEVIPEQEGTLESIAVAENQLIAHHQRDAHSQLTVYNLAGEQLHDLPLPDYASTAMLTANPDAPECFYSVQSFDRPPAIIRGDLTDNTTSILDKTDIDVDSEMDLVVRQEWFESTDGAEVPVFICHREESALDGDNPTLLYGYGGFRQSLTPTFDRFRLPFLADGGVYAQVCARGGQEFGEAWHEAGMLENKQHTFDDFIGCAEHLIERGYTNSDRLAVGGGSNGGLSVGAVITQRPDLFAAAVSAVPLLDMLRFHQFLLGESWTTEYGSPEDEDAYHYIRQYSPYHNVEARDYPVTLFTTAIGDTRVDPSHARKMTARMQRKSTSGPILLRTNDNTGHGLGKPTSMILDEQLDQWTFLYDQLGLDPE
jgi:prolyl oligopeptidase